jgi:predicted ABC-type exoprotein transport system permease subunit
MKKAVKVSLKIGKIIVFALFAVQCVFAIWWVIKNIMVVPDFAIPSESYGYIKLTDFLGSGFWVVYLLQGVAMYLAIKELFPKNIWVACFAITNPLMIQFIFALVPDVLCVAIILEMLGMVLHGKRIRGKHVIFLFLLGMLSAQYFLAGIIILIVAAIKQYMRDRKRNKEQKVTKAKVSNWLMFVQILLVIVLILVSYQTRGNENDATSVQVGIEKRFTIDENIPANHSKLSVAKGIVTDVISNIITPYTYMQVMDQKKLTQNGWNYENFTREEPELSKQYMGLSERNGIIALAIMVFTSLFAIAFGEQKIKINSDSVLFLITCFVISMLVTVTSKRGVDYRVGLFIVPIWYGVILSWFKQIKVLPNKEEIENL